MSIHEADLRIRPANADDFEVIRHLEDTIFPEDPWTEGMISEELASPARAYFIAERLIINDLGGTADLRENTAIIGYAGITLGLDADIMTIGVMPNARRAGVGARLVEAMLAAAREAGAERVFLEVRASNEVAQELYERHGFERIGRVRGYFRNPSEDAVTMRHIVLSESDLS